MRIRCSGRPIQSLAMAACVDLGRFLKGRSVRTLVAGMALSAAIALSSPAWAKVVLISDEEANVPPPTGAVVVDRRGVTRAPKVDLVSTSGGSVQSPMRFQLKFVSFGGARIDPDSVRFTYIRTPNVDLTPRLKAFVKTTGIDVPDVELPAGDHIIRVEIKDSDGRASSTSFLLKVAP